MTENKSEGIFDEINELEVKFLNIIEKTRASLKEGKLQMNIIDSIKNYLGSIDDSVESELNRYNSKIEKKKLTVDDKDVILDRVTYHDGKQSSILTVEHKDGNFHVFHVFSVSDDLFEIQDDNELITAIQKQIDEINDTVQKQIDEINDAI